ncbi:probable G-protein coupled receptor No18 [Planococcus citri]|uniref:probable G-protein coupled receptor No18 n=1 Tax=Planococcus citri TaxID=170843 RepID=UPI0031F7DE3A
MDLLTVVDGDCENEDFNSTNCITRFNFTWQQVILTTIFCSLISVTVVGNTLIIIAVITTRRLRTVTNCFIMSLAVADWLVGAFVMPLAVSSHLRGSWEWGWLLCDIWISSDVCLCTASILSLCAISLDRYFAITSPLNYSKRLRSKRLAFVMILIVWVTAIFITCPPMFGWRDADRHISTVCTYNQNRIYVVFSAMGSFFVPLTVMLYVYVKISRVIAERHNTLHVLNQPTQKIKLKKAGEPEDSDRSERISSESEDQHKMNRRQSKLSGGARSSQNPPLDVNSSVKISSFKREHKTAQTLTMVVGGFVACWLPFFCVYLANPFLPDGTIPTLLMVFLTWLGWLNSAINPFIYAFYNPDFRIALWRITLRRCATKKQQAKMLRSRTLRQSVYMKQDICLLTPTKTPPRASNKMPS